MNGTSSWCRAANSRLISDSMPTALEMRRSGAESIAYSSSVVAQWQRELPGLNVSGLAVFGRLHRSYLLYAARLTEIFDRYGINTASFDVLAALRRSGPPYRATAGRLARTGLITTGGVTQRLDRLESAGLITRERDPGDRRVVYAQLTADGLEVSGRAATAVFASQQQMLAGLTETERAELAVLLGAVERSMRAQR